MSMGEIGISNTRRPAVVKTIESILVTAGVFGVSKEKAANRLSLMLMQESLQSDGRGFIRGWNAAVDTANDGGNIEQMT